MKTRILLFFLSVGTLIGNAQSFSPAFESFSGGKVSYVNLVDGTKLEGTIDDLDRKKGLIEEITLVDASGKKYKLKPEQIRDMYLPPSNFARFNEVSDMAGEASRWGNGSVNKDIVSQGYAYFENSKVFVKKDERVMMVQLINPASSGNIRVYSDPFAKETAGIGFAGVNVVGGDDKSYYVKVGDKTAFRLYKKDYEDEFKNIFAGCQPVLDAFGKDIVWTQFAKAVAMYSKECEK